MPLRVEPGHISFTGWAALGCLISTVLQVIGLIAVFLWIIGPH